MGTNRGPKKQVRATCSVAFSYSGNDVLRTVSPAPNGENTKKAQYQFDGLGRLQSVCEITGAAGSGACSQNTAATGFFTSYTYDLLNNLTGVSQSGQTRTYVYDGLSRLTSETNPESGTTTYTYDAPTASCSNSYWNPFDPGNLIQRQDANGWIRCYTYDPAHRVTSIGPGNIGACVFFEYDYVDPFNLGIPAGVSVNNIAGRLSEVDTIANCQAPHTWSDFTTEEFFSYSPRGDVTDVYQSTANSGGYYHVSESYYPNGLPQVLNLYNSAGTQMIPAITYNADGEGRVASTSVSSGQNPLSNVNYNVFGAPTSLGLGSGDADAFTYDPNTGRMTQYQFTVNGSSVAGVLTWNPNGTLQRNAITDPFNSSDQQTCNYGYDDLARLASANCGTIWSQLFNPDPFGNLSKSGTITFQPGFNSATNRANTGSYDANGNLTGDGVNTYSWDADGNVVNVSSNYVGNVGLTFDALDRIAERNINGSYTQYVYGTTGSRLAITSGQTLAYAVVPLAGGTTAVYNASGLAYYRHGDWQGSSRLTSLPSGTSRVSYDGAYAPYGESYAEMGSLDHQFTGKNQDIVPGGPYQLYDFPAREYHPTWGRWVSPDPVGLGAVDPSNPQSWNRYAYVTNNPLALIDPSGLDQCAQAADPRACRIGSYYGLGNNPTFGYIDPYEDEFDLLSGSGDPCSDPWYAESNVECGSSPVLPGGGGIGGTSIPGLPSGPSGGSGIPGSAGGFQSGADVMDSPWIFQVTAWGWPWLAGEVAACAANPFCAVPAATVAVAGAGYLVYTHFAKGAQGDVGHDYIRQEARELARKLGISYCDALDMIYKAARAAGNSKRANDTKATQKQDGCRGH